MESRRITLLLTLFGSSVGGYVPTLWGASAFSFGSIICAALGGVVGIWVAFRLTH